MIKYDLADLFMQDSTEINLIVQCSDGMLIDNGNLRSKFTLTESICSEKELRFGRCEASEFKVTTADVITPFKGKTIDVSMILDGHTDKPFKLGRYKIVSDNTNPARTSKEIVAYDALYDVIHANVVNWYNSLLPNADSTTTLKRMRDSFFAYFGIKQQTVNLVNDNMIIEKTVDAERISGQDVLTAMLELNGCFGHIGRDNEFKYIFLMDDSRFGLYPRDDLYPANDLYPINPKSHGVSQNTYITCEYEDFETKEITKIQIRQEQDDIGCIYGDDGNTYIIEGNFLVFGKTAEELEIIARNLLPIIKNRTYRPANVYAKANPCLEVGDAIRMSTKREMVESYIFKRVLSGKQALKDTYTSQGVEEYSEKVTGRNSQIIQLKGLSNKIIHTVEENRQEMKNIEKGFSSTISQTAEAIKTEVSKTYETKTDAQTTKTTLDSKINQTAKEIRSEVKSVTQMYDTTGYTVKYQEAKAPNIDVEVGAIWLDTSTGDLYEGVFIPEEWLNLGDFHGARLSGSTECRWYKVGARTTIYRTYGVGSGYRAGWDMQKQGGFNQEPPTASSCPINTWWLNIKPYYEETERKYTLEQYLANLDNCEEDDYMTLYEKKSNARYEWRHIRKCPIITLSDIGSEVMQLAGEIVLKVRADGKIASVQLKADPEKGTEFKVKADNISLTAAEVINLMSNGELNLSGKNITIKSDNFSVTKDGTVRCKKIVEFGLDDAGKSSFNNCVSNTTIVQQVNNDNGDIKKVQETINTHIKNLVGPDGNSGSIGQIRDWINQLSGQLRELGKPGIS